MKITTKIMFNEYFNLVKKGVRKEQFIGEPIKLLANFLSVSPEDIVLYQSLYSLLNDFFNAMELNEKKVYSFPTFNNDLLKFLLDHNVEFLEMKTLLECKLNINNIENGSVLIIPSIFGLSYNIDNETLEKLGEKNVLILPIITDYNFMSGFYTGDYSIFSFSQNCSFFMEDISVLVFRKKDIDFRILGNCGFLGERHFIWQDNIPTLSSQFYLLKALQNYYNMEDYFSFVYKFIENKLYGREYWQSLTYLLIKSNNENLQSLNVLKYFPNVNFPNSYIKILNQWRFVELDVFNYENLDKQLQEVLK